MEIKSADVENQTNSYFHRVKHLIKTQPLYISLKNERAMCQNNRYGLISYKLNEILRTTADVRKYN